MSGAPFSEALGRIRRALDHEGGARESLVSTAFIVLVGVGLAALLIQLRGDPPVATIWAGLTYALGGSLRLARTLAWGLPLYVACLGVAVAFRSGMFNIGAEGQLYAGAMASAVVGAYLGPMWKPLHLALALGAAGVIGALVAAGLGWLRAAWNVDEVLSTLLSNYIIILFTTYLVVGPLRDPSRQSGTSRPVLDTARFVEIFPRTGLTRAAFLVAVLAIAVWWLSERSVLGYRWRMTGQSAPFAAAVGIDVRRAQIGAMAASGLLCGVSGALLVTVSQGRFWTAIGTGIGWDAVLLALIGRARPVATIGWVTVYVVIRSSARGIEQVSDVPSELSLVLISAIIIAAVAQRGLFAVVGPRLRALRGA